MVILSGIVPKISMAFLADFIGSEIKLKVKNKVSRKILKLHGRRIMVRSLWQNKLNGGEGEIQ